MTLESISLDQLAAVTGGLAAPKAAKAPAAADKAAAPLKTRRIGDVKLIGNQSLDQMYWESKPF